ncbi:MAG: sialate O-acetylesterase [Dysgonamonadaceae bacterium]|jgi:sialate O-acetylesterase|nr:sialate O-acetylesterase [Dysgonamonadaceae bacterium]
MKNLITFLTLFLLATCLSGQVSLPKIISDGMVLQRDTPLKIWGWASPNEKITVSFNGFDHETTADRNGNWQTVIHEQKAGGPYSMTITASNSITINDILIGDVWLCSGQSNMELQISRVMDMFADDIKKINNPYIRHYKTPTHRYSYEQPEQDLPGGEWKSATPENIMNFSALAYFFAENLYNKYKIPIGLFNSSVGGSPAEAWISIETAKRYPEYIESLDKLIAIEKTRQENKGNQADENFRRFMESMPKDAGLSKWHKADVDDSDWDEISLPGYWKDKDIDFGSGVIWLRKEIEVPPSMAGKEGILRLGCIVNSDSAFINGAYAGNITYQYPPRIYPVKEGLLKEGKNVITVRIVSSGFGGGFVEEKPYKLIVGDETIDLTGQWKYKVGADYSKAILPAASTPPSESTNRNMPPIIRYTPVGLYNSMIAPAINTSIKGVIWYQGESNTGRANEYEKLMSDLIADWRDKFDNPQLPFIYVQLANFMKVQKAPMESGWAELRNVQRKTLYIPNTGMAVAIDLGEWNDIHPLNKKELGRRLALEAQRVAYGESLVSQGPLYKSMEIKNNSIILTFTSVGSGIYTNLDLHGFAIAGEDGKYEWANAVVIAKDKIKVWNNSIKSPVKVRYAWADNPDDANLKNKEGFPASPFQTE